MSGEWGGPQATGLAARSRGALALAPARCTSCLACARECPTWCIDIEAHTETAPPASTRSRVRTVTVLDRFTIDVGLCMYCGLCVEVCPFDALSWTSRTSPPAADREGLRHESDRLASASPVRPEGGPTTAGQGAGNTGSFQRR